MHINEEYKMGTYTGRNIMKDIKNAMNMIKDDWQLTKQCTSYNHEMLTVVEQFKKEHMNSRNLER